ncbi:MAG: zinc transport system substrate-binding protein [Bradymonadia bacterium]|jgi:zinc transport system substrate-binding protein
MKTLAPLMMILALLACSAPPPAESLAAQPLVVATSTYPLYWMASTLAGADADVFLAPPAEVDPALWAPDDAAIQRLQSADRILVNGAGFEGWVDTTSLPLSRVIDTSTGLKARLRSGRGHHHGPGDGQRIDPHFWLDPQLAQVQLTAVVAQLRGRVADAALDARRDRLTAAFTLIEATLTRLGKAAGDQVFLANHRAYDYLAARASLRVHSLDLSPDAGAAQADPVCIVARRLKARHMLWESAPTPALAAALRACKVEPHVLRPLESPPPEGSYFRAHQADLEALITAMSPR